MWSKCIELWNAVKTDLHYCQRRQISVSVIQMLPSSSLPICLFICDYGNFTETPLMPEFTNKTMFQYFLTNLHPWCTQKKRFARGTEWSRLRLQNNSDLSSLSNQFKKLNAGFVMMPVLRRFHWPADDFLAFNWIQIVWKNSVHVWQGDVLCHLLSPFLG